MNGWSLREALQHAFPLDEVLRKGASVLLIVLVACLLYLLVGRALRAAVAASTRRLPDPGHRQRVTTLLLLAGNVVRYALIFLATFYVFVSLGLNVAPVLTSLGIVGLAVGFGAQNLVRDVVSGFFIITEGQYGVGDRVEINGTFGTVEEVGLRVTRLRDPSGQLRYFANGAIAQVSRYPVEGIAYRLVVPCAGGTGDPAAAATARVLEDFDRELHVFAAPPVLQAPEVLGSYAQVLPVALHLLPGRQALVTEKLPARLTTTLSRLGHPLPEGTEVTLALACPCRGDAGGL